MFSDVSNFFSIVAGNFSIRSTRAIGPAVGPVIPASVRSTPLRDNLNINDPSGGGFNEDDDDRGSVMMDNDDTRSLVSGTSSAINPVLLKQQLRSDLSSK